MRNILKSYFYWTYPRGCFHYDVMVSLILVFIFVTPWVWDYGDRPYDTFGPQHTIEVVGNPGRMLILTVQAADVNVSADASAATIKRALRRAIEPVTGDAVFVEHWETVKDAAGNTAWKVWAHR